MKYEVEIEINRPIKKVIKLFDSFENLKKWQPNLQNIEHIEGTPGEKGAKTLLTYDENGKKVELTEIILNRNLPDEFSALYKSKKVKNKVVNRFVEKDENITTWKNENEFYFSGIMKIVGYIMKPLFPKQTLKDMKSFKNFVENQQL